MRTNNAQKLHVLRERENRRKFVRTCVHGHRRMKCGRFIFSVHYTAAEQRHFTQRMT